MALGTEAERTRVSDEASAIIRWGYEKYGESDSRDFAIGDVDRGGDIEEAANVMVESLWDEDTDRLRRAMHFLEREGVPKNRLRPAREILGRESDDWRL